MPVYLLSDDLIFPPPEGASEDGVVAVGGDASPPRLALGYSQGIFPGPHHRLPLLVLSPDRRFVLPLGDVHVRRSLRKRVRSGAFEDAAHTAFDAVVAGCAEAERPE